jgi:hypothetical protein
MARIARDLRLCGGWPSAPRLSPAKEQAVIRMLQANHNAALAAFDADGVVDLSIDGRRRLRRGHAHRRPLPRSMVEAERRVAERAANLCRGELTASS